MGVEEEIAKLVPEEAREFVIVILDEMAKRGITKEEAWSKMKQIATSEYVAKSYAGNPVALWTYAAEAAKAVMKTQRGGETVKASLIPIGVSPVRTTKNGRRSSVFAAIKTESGWKLDEIVFRGALALTVEKVELFKYYNDVTLMNRGYFYEATTSTNLNGTSAQPVDDIAVLQKLGVKKVRMIEMKDALSRTDDRGFVDRSDLRMFEGYVGSPWSRIDDEKQIGAYDVTDNTIEDDGIIAPDGTIVKPTIRVWCHPRFVKYAEGSKLLFVGTLEKRRDDNVVFMNAIYVKPLIVTGVLEGGDS